MARPRKDQTKAVPATPAAQVPLVPQQQQQQQQQQPTAPANVPLMPQPPVAMAPPMDAGSNTLTINRAEYERVRNSVHARLSTIQELLKDFASDYLRQSNMLLGEPTSLDNVPALQTLARLDQAAVGFAPPVGAEVAVPPVEEKKERKKRQHDPNAPKRPLTPYFLYMQTARPIIATDLGNEAPKGAVQDEGQRRWASMNPDEKMAWNNAYQFNLRLYHARVASYKAGNLAAREMSDQDALAYADANAIPQPNVGGTVDEPAVVNDQDAIVEQLQMTAPVVAPAAAAISDEVAKTPKPKGSTRKRKSTAADSEDVEASAVKTATPASPDKKRKRASKVAEPATEEPKKSARKKKNA
ncbi:hypothetical protein PG993_006070 [Apiospora rasikravindrae]|uniref:HMG box domain-containing protein n=1 Tax=Apiospora rasikravindrae TaxID=990691 RepID=A0ABR1TCE2_9PEZI